MNQNQTVHVIGAGLAGVEAAYQVAKNGINVKLYEMRPVKMTPAHHTGNFAELVLFFNSLLSSLFSFILYFFAYFFELQMIFLFSCIRYLFFYSICVATRQFLFS